MGAAQYSNGQRICTTTQALPTPPPAAPFVVPVLAGETALAVRVLSWRGRGGGLARSRLRLTLGAWCAPQRASAAPGAVVGFPTCLEPVGLGNLHLSRERASHPLDEIDDTALREVEDAQIAALVGKEAQNGLRLATDGEFRRSWWHFDFFGMLDGVEVVELDHGIQFQGVQTRPLGLQVGGRIGFSDTHPFLAHFRALADATAATGATPKFTIPAPTVFDFRLEPAGITTGLYADRDALVPDLRP